MKRILLQTLFVISLAAGAHAQQQKPPAQAEPDLKYLREHIELLASDGLEGRKTGTQGATGAAVYIGGKFYGYGLECPDPSWMCHHTSNNHIGYMKEFPYVAGVEAGKGNSMLLTSVAAATTTSAAVPPTTLDLRVGEDWMPLGFSANARVENALVVFVGYSIAAGELNYDDYAGADVAGRVALAFAGTPDGDNPHGKFVRFGELRFKAAAARAAGAKALVLIAGEENFKDDKLSRLTYDNAGGDAGLPVAVVSRQAAAQMMGLGGASQLSEFEKKVREALSASGGDAAKKRGYHVNVAAKPSQNRSLSISTDVVRRNAEAYNVVGLLEGSDPKLNREAIVIGAHYDHLGRGGQGSLAAREGEIHHGADDNASGVAALLELARIFSKEKVKLRRTVVFIAFGGEEEGLLGSSFYVRNPVVPLAQTIAMINMDMIGRMRDDKLMIGGVGTAREWRQLITDANARLDLRLAEDAGRGREARPASEMPVVVGANGQTMATASLKERFALTLNEDGFGPSDHSSFYAQKIPVLFFFTGTHSDYHKPTDTSERINYEGEGRIVSFVRDIVRALDASERRPSYTLAKSESAGRSTGFRVYLGTIPNYAESSDGLKLDAVRDDSPASKAGLKAGDRIVKLAGRDVRNVYDYTYALSEMKAGQEYEVEVVRDGGQRLTMKITPDARK